MSKRIGLLNLQYIDNYGANMISYAMESVCHELSPDDEVHTINYSVDENIIYLQSNTFKNLCVCYGFKHAILTKIKSFVKRSRFVLLNNRISRPIKERFKRAFGIKSVAARSSQNIPFQTQRLENFQKFRENHLNLTKKYNDESFINDGFGAVIVGSDVVWKPQRLLCKAVNKVFFLKSNNNINRIAYAASLGISDMEKMNRLKEYYQKAIDDFNYVSIRESSGRDYIQSLFPDRKIHNCIDPVFLCSADEYEKLVPQQCADDKYIYAYILGKNPDAINYVNCLAKEKNLKIYYHSNSYFEHGENTYTDGPCEFLQRIKNLDADLGVVASYGKKLPKENVTITPIFRYKTGEKVDLTDLETYYLYREKFDKSLVSRLTHKQRLLLHPLLLKIIKKFYHYNYLPNTPFTKGFFLKSLFLFNMFFSSFRNTSILLYHNVYKNSTI